MQSFKVLNNKAITVTRSLSDRYWVDLYSRSMCAYIGRKIKVVNYATDVFSEKQLMLPKSNKRLQIQHFICINEKQ